jgi:hypothetical protein
MSGVAHAEVSVDVDVAAAFEVFTTEVNAWYRIDRNTVGDMNRPTNLAFEPHVGGRFVDIGGHPSHNDIVIGTITVWEPPHRIVFVEGRGCDVEITFRHIDANTTRVCIEQRGIDQLPADVADHVPPVRLACGRILVQPPPRHDPRPHEQGVRTHERHHPRIAHPRRCQLRRRHSVPVL